MVCWPSVLCRRAVRQGLRNGCRRPKVTPVSLQLHCRVKTKSSGCEQTRSPAFKWAVQQGVKSRCHSTTFSCVKFDHHNTSLYVCSNAGVSHPSHSSFSDVSLKVDHPVFTNNLGAIQHSYSISTSQKCRNIEPKFHTFYDDTQRCLSGTSCIRHSRFLVPRCPSYSLSSTPGSFHRSLVMCVPKGIQVARFSAQSPDESTPAKESKDVTKVQSIATLPSTPALSEVPRPKGAVGYIIARYTWYVERLQRTLESEMPRTFRMFRIFGVGLKAFINDFTGYVRVLVKLSFPSVRLESLGLHQLQLYHFMPYDMVKVFPVLLISAIPFGQNLALPLGYLFPRQLLCRHFWDLQQSHDFAMRDLRRRVLYARPVFRCLQASVAGIELLNARVCMQSVCHLLGSGRHPRNTQVMQLRELFAAAPYGLKSIKRHHAHSLLRLHGLSAVLTRKRLRDHARWLLCHDRALTKEAGVVPLDCADAAPDASRLPGAGAEAGDIEGRDPTPSLQYDLASLHVNVLKTSLLLRGISPIGLDSSGMAKVLDRWLAVSLQLSSDDSSLLLHLPILLFYNHPTNMALVAR